MSFLTKIDMLSLEQKRDLKDSEIDFDFKCFIPIHPIGDSSKNKFFVKKSRKASLTINVGEQRIHFSDTVERSLHDARIDGGIVRV